jgi:hypothetical protein
MNERDRYTKNALFGAKNSMIKPAPRYNSLKYTFSADFWSGFLGRFGQKK